MNKLVITTRNKVVYYGYFQDGKPVELYCEKKESAGILGNIYVARVEKVAEGIEGVFLELTKEQKAYYHYSPLRKPVKLSSGHEDKLYGGDLILVQVTKEAVKSKLPVVDGNVSISGKYYVLSLERKGVHISRKIEDPEEKARLLDLTKQYRADHPDPDCGIVIRTNARYVPGEELLREISELTARCSDLLRKAARSPGKTLVGQEPSFYIQIGKELPSRELNEILTDDEDIFQELNEYYGESNKIRLYEDDYPLFLLYRFGHYYRTALSRLVPLRSGGSIVIEQTEAMVVIDVNSGSVLKKKAHAISVFENMNREAAMEIGYQLRLRNLSGIIVIDFINMRDPTGRKKLLDLLKEICKSDRIPVRVVDYTALNLVEMTRSKVRKTLAEQWRECHSDPEGMPF